MVVSNDHITFIKKSINYRHKIVHVSALTTPLNIEKMPEEEPVFSNIEFLSKNIDAFDEFIKKLHGATLELRK